MLELAAVGGHAMPADDPDALAAWLRRPDARGSLGRYLAGFEHPIAIMQNAAGLRRIAREAVEDLAADGIVYAEVRFAPELHTREGLDLAQAVMAVIEGLDEGERSAERSGRGILTRLLLVAMRDRRASPEVAGLVGLTDRVIGFDLAGPEDGHPASDHAAALRALRERGAHLTLHAGESDRARAVGRPGTGSGPQGGPDDPVAQDVPRGVHRGLADVGEAVELGAERIGHGLALADDIRYRGYEPVLGPVISKVRRLGIALEMCPSSNVDTGSCRSIEDHPFDLLRRLGCRVTVNTDNRTVSGTTLSRELHLLAGSFDYDLADLASFTVTAMQAAFVSERVREDIIEGVIRPGFRLLAGA